MSKNQIIFILVNLFLSLILSIIYSTLIFLPITIIYIISINILVNKNNKNLYSHLTLLTIIGTLSTLLLYYGYLEKYGAPYYIGGSDDLAFEDAARYAISNNLNTYFDLKEASSDWGTYLYDYWNCLGYILLLSKIMKISIFFGGYSTLIMRILNIYLLIMLAVLVYKNFINKNKNINKKYSLIILYFIAAFPNALFISGHIFRDVINAFLLFLFFYLLNNFSSFNKSRKISTMIFVPILMILLFLIREQNIYITIGILLLFLYFKFSKKFSKTYLIVILPILLVSSIVIFFATGLFDKILVYYDRYSGLITTDNDGLSAYIFKLPLIPFGFIARGTYGLLCPFPTALLNVLYGLDIVTFFDVIISIGTIIQIFLLPYLIKSFKKFNFENMSFIIVYLSIVLTTFTFRHFLLIYPFLFTLIFKEFLKCKKDTIFKTSTFMVFAISFGLFVYALIK